MVKSDKTDLNFHAGHRQRLRQKFLDGHLADYELLELILSFVIPRRDVRPLARGLIAHFGSIYQILTAPIDDLQNFKGIGYNTAIFLKAICHLMITGCKFKLAEQPIFHNEQILTNYCILKLSGKTVEEFHVLYLDMNMRLIADDLHSIGTIDWTPVFTRDIVKRALDLSARSVVLMHNHPTPNTSFSTTDIEMTESVEKALAQFDIELYDHYVVSGGIVYSARNMFLLKQIHNIAN